MRSEGPQSVCVTRCWTVNLFVWVGNDGIQHVLAACVCVSCEGEQSSLTLGTTGHTNKHHIPQRLPQQRRGHSHEADMGAEAAGRENCLDIFSPPNRVFVSAASQLVDTFKDACFPTETSLCSRLISDVQMCSVRWFFRNRMTNNTSNDHCC